VNSKLTTGAVVAIGGTWVLAQVLRGGALERLGIIDNRTGSNAAKHPTTPGGGPTPTPTPSPDDRRERTVPTPGAPTPQPAPSPSPGSF
jgi:hypothetical protein